MLVTTISNNLSQQQSCPPVYMDDDNYLGRCVEWIRQDRPWYEQAIVYTAVVLAMLALTATVVGIPLVVLALQENDKLALQDHVDAGDKQIMEKFGGPQKFQEIPLRVFPRLNWDSFSDSIANSMQDSLERTTDQFDRPGVLMRIRDNKTHRVFVQAIFRKFVYDPQWDYSRGAFSIFNGRALSSEDLQTLGKVLQGNHRRYSLQ